MKKDEVQYHICLNGGSAEGHVDAYPIGMDELQAALEDLLEQEAYQDDSEIEIYVFSKLKTKTTKKVEIVEE